MASIDINGREVKIIHSVIAKTARALAGYVECEIAGRPVELFCVLRDGERSVERVWRGGQRIDPVGNRGPINLGESGDSVYADELLRALHLSRGADGNGVSRLLGKSGPDGTFGYYLCRGLLSEMGDQAKIQMTDVLLQAYNLGWKHADGSDIVTVPHQWTAIADSPRGPDPAGRTGWYCAHCSVSAMTEGSGPPPAAACYELPFFDLATKLIETARSLEEAKTQVAKLKLQTDPALSESLRKREKQIEDLTGRLREEEFLHAACLSIAEGAPNWEQPVKGEGASQVAVRQLRQRADSLQANLETCNDLLSVIEDTMSRVHPRATVQRLLESLEDRKDYQRLRALVPREGWCNREQRSSPLCSTENQAGDRDCQLENCTDANPVARASRMNPDSVSGAPSEHVWGIPEGTYHRRNPDGSTGTIITIRRQSAPANPTPDDKK